MQHRQLLMIDTPWIDRRFLAIFYFLFSIFNLLFSIFSIFHFPFLNRCLARNATNNEFANGKWQIENKK